MTKRAGTEGQSFNCGFASASVLLNDQFKSDMPCDLEGTTAGAAIAAKAQPEEAKIVFRSRRIMEIMPQPLEPFAWSACIL